MQTIGAPVVGYLATVLAVIGIASAAVFDLNGMTAKAHRDWDADIDRIIAQQQEKRRLVEMASLERGAPSAGFASDAEAEVAAALATGPSADDVAGARETSTQRAQSQGGKKPGRRVARRGERLVPAAFVNLPKFAATTAATTLLRLR